MLIDLVIYCGILNLAFILKILRTIVMSKYRKSLPQMSNDLFLTDGGLETTLVFKHNYDLPEFAAFTLLGTKEGRESLEKYFRCYAELAKEKKVGFILESMTWRASSSWGKKIGYDDSQINIANREAINLLGKVRRELESEDTPMVISGCMGPIGDGYNISEKMSVEESEDYHKEQIKTFYETEADMVSAFTMNYVEEALGLTKAAQAIGMPVVISFTVETDGRLPSGQALGDAIVQVDQETSSGPAYYMINCAHPTHFSGQLEEGLQWLKRLKGVRANASTKSHAELDESVELDEGDPIALGSLYRNIRERLPHINIVGGCCGTDLKHIKEICKACMA